VRVPKSVFTPAYARLLELLVETRKAAGVTQAELARRLGRPQPFISYVESGERRLDVVEYYAIMRALDVDPEAKFKELIEKLPKKVDI